MPFFSILIIVACAYSERYNNENATKLFEYYKMKYSKHYKNELEMQQGLNNYVNNLNKVAALNEKASNDTLYVLNKYADVNPEEIQERFGLSLKPYYSVNDPQHAIRLRPETGRFIEDTFLYDLTETDQLYRQFMATYNKPIAKKKLDREARYYRFLKTLIEINKNNVEGYKQRKIEADADVIKAPHDYFY